MSAKLSRSEVADHGLRAQLAGACAATLASTSSASSPCGTTTTTPSSRSTSTARSSCRSRRLRLGLPLGLVGRPAPLAAAVAAVVEPDHHDVRADPVDRGDELAQQAPDRPALSRRPACGTSVRAEAWKARCSSEFPSTASTVGWDIAASLDPRGHRSAGISRQRRGPRSRWRRTRRASEPTEPPVTGRGSAVFGPCPSSCRPCRRRSASCLGASPSAVSIASATFCLDQLRVRLVGVEQRRDHRQRGDLLALRLERQADEPVDLAGRDARLHHRRAGLGDLLEVPEHRRSGRAGRASRPSRTSAGPSASSRRSPRGPGRTTGSGSRSASACRARCSRRRREPRPPIGIRWRTLSVTPPTASTRSRNPLRFTIAQ